MVEKYKPMRTQLGSSQEVLLSQNAMYMMIINMKIIYFYNSGLKGK